MKHSAIMAVVAASWIASVASVTSADEAETAKPLLADMRAVFDKPLYEGSTWGLLAVDLDSGDVIYDLASERKFLTGSVRKVITIGLALDTLGAEYRFNTGVYRHGPIEEIGVLEGDLILVASGDLSMGGRRNPDGSLAISNYDHNEANSLGNAGLTKPDPLAGYKSLAEQVAAAGIREVRGDVIIDDRLFEPFNFRGEFDVRPIFINDDVVDVMIRPAAVGKAASVDWRPKSAAFAVLSSLTTAEAESELQIEVTPEYPTCFGMPGCKGTVSGKLPVGFTPPLTNRYPLVRTFRIVEPQNYSRTEFIEALKEAGVNVAADAVAKNPTDKLPAETAYDRDMKVAELVSAPYAEYAKWILKVSYNIGADTSLVLYGLNQGGRSMADALAAEKRALAKEFNIAPDEYAFIDGSGGGDSAATPAAIVSFLRSMRNEPFFGTYRDCLPGVAVDGSLTFVTDFLRNPSLAGAKGNMYAKPGTFVEGNDKGELSLRAQAFAGYIHASSGRRLAYAVFVNDVAPISGLDDIMQVFQDQGTISAILWREN